MRKASQSKTPWSLLRPVHDAPAGLKDGHDVTWTISEIIEAPPRRRIGTCVFPGGRRGIGAPSRTSPLWLGELAGPVIQRHAVHAASTAHRLVSCASRMLRTSRAEVGVGVEGAGLGEDERGDAVDVDLETPSVGDTVIVPAVGPPQPSRRGMLSWRSDPSRLQVRAR